MFWDKYEELCRKNNTSPTAVALKLNISRSNPTAWKKGNTPSSSALKRIADYFGVTVEHLLGEEDKQPTPKGVKIPVYGRIAAGIPIEATEDIIDYEEIPEAMAKSGEYMALQIQGDSMEPRMYSGDVVIIRKQPDCESGQICAVYVNGYEATIKKVIKRTGGITLVPLNTAYPPKNYTNKDISDLSISILGVAVELRGKL